MTDTDTAVDVDELEGIGVRTPHPHDDSLLYFEWGSPSAWIRIAPDDTVEVEP